MPPGILINDPPFNESEGRSAHRRRPNPNPTTRPPPPASLDTLGNDIVECVLGRPVTSPLSPAKKEETYPTVNLLVPDIPAVDAANAARVT